VEAISGIVGTAVTILTSLAVVVGAGVGLYIYYTASGQEEGE